ncbi:MAG: RelA/SpoT domain-containing protein [Ilumatobacteraceae bacterium]
MSDDDRLLLADLRRTWRSSEKQLKIELEGRFSQNNFQFYSRLKNLGTIREKLIRSALPLSRIRDIVGLRIVISGGRGLQDSVVSEIVNEVNADRCRVIDRRSKPRSGYRAVHVELIRGAAISEIQVRTQLQHQWANLFESLSKVVGRGIRYGEPPFVGHLSVDAKSSVLELLHHLADLSTDIARVEESGTDTHDVRDRLDIENSVINDLQRGLD